MTFRLAVLAGIVLLASAMPGLASHPGAGVLVSKGLVVGEDGPVAATLAFRPCRGPTWVTVTYETPLGPVQESFAATFDIIPAPLSDCIDYVFGAAAARLWSEQAGMSLAGSVVGFHLVVSLELAGLHHQDHPAAFGIAFA